MLRAMGIGFYAFLSHTFDVSSWRAKFPLLPFRTQPLFHDKGRRRNSFHSNRKLFGLLKWMLGKVAGRLGQPMSYVVNCFDVRSATFQSVWYHQNVCLGSGCDTK